jgi:CheY-like chemotaxis protein
MKQLEFKIAWIDNQPNEVRSYQERIASLLSRSGFELQVEWVSSKDELERFLANLSGQSDYDFIMVDWKLGQMEIDDSGGATVANRIRGKHSYSTIIFYSAERPAVLKEQIAGKLVDGVFCINRTHFFDEASPLIRNAIKRASGFDAMRGIFLSAVADFDEVIKGCLHKAFSSLPDEYKSKVVESLISGKLEFAHKISSSAKDMPSTRDLAVAIRHLKPGSNDLFNCLVAVLRFKNPSPEYQRALELFEKYGDQVLLPRNDLAHLREEERGGEKVLVRGDRTWKSEDFADLRHKLQDHHDNLNYIRKSLLDELAAAF